MLRTPATASIVRAGMVSVLNTTVPLANTARVIPNVQSASVPMACATIRRLAMRPLIAEEISSAIVESANSCLITS